MAPLTQRRAARAILLDRTGRVLLIRFAVPRDGKTFIFWATPGGSVKLGETDLQAAQREIKEELAVEIVLAGPIHTSVDEFIHKGTLCKAPTCISWADLTKRPLNFKRSPTRSGQPCRKSSGGHVRSLIERLIRFSRPILRR